MTFNNISKSLWMSKSFSFYETPVDNNGHIRPYLTVHSSFRSVDSVVHLRLCTRNEPY